MECNVNPKQDVRPSVVISETVRILVGYEGVCWVAGFVNIQRACFSRLKL